MGGYLRPVSLGGGLLRKMEEEISPFCLWGHSLSLQRWGGGLQPPLSPSQPQHNSQEGIFRGKRRWGNTRFLCPDMQAGSALRNGAGKGGRHQRARVEEQSPKYCADSHVFGGRW